MAGRLTLVATPIGNLGDLSPRAAETLRGVDFWLVEDSRVSGKLAVILETKKSMIVVNDHSEGRRLESALERLRAGESAALLSDAGTPVISDPGAQLVDACYEEGIEVDAIPGPSAVATALCLSGFFAQRYAFLGFLPKKPGDLARLFEPFAESPLTLVYFESPHRVSKTIEVISPLLGERRIAICREMTKIHQETRRGMLADPVILRGIPEKGEFTVVIEGRRRKGFTDN
jgi:16S rRNA (cytidine1402-2'-O)-methyltransferase